MHPLEIKKILYSNDKNKVTKYITTNSFSQSQGLTADYYQPVIPVGFDWELCNVFVKDEVVYWVWKRDEFFIKEEKLKEHDISYGEFIEEMVKEKV